MPDDLRGRHDVVDLSANENPLGPPPAVVRAITANAGLVHRYPDSEGASLRAALARKLGVEAGNLVLGNGSTEIFDLLARALFGGGGEAVIGWPSSPTHRAAVERAGGEIIRVPLVQHAYDLDAIAARVGPRTRLVIIGNPNNPTGLALSKAALDRFLNRLPHGPIVCLDEAYAEYVSKPDFSNSLDYIATGRPLVTVRSMSKAYGLAGLRMGYAIAPEALALSLNSQRQPFNTNSLAQIAALAALGDSDHLASTIALNASGRDWLATRLSLLGLFFLPSEANFLLVRVGDGARVYNDLRKNGVLVKQLDAFGLPEYIRVSVGSSGENARFIACLQRAIRA